jgi:hypothetical protein
MSGKTEETSTLPECCRPAAERKGQGLLWGLFYGLVPHTFCILFIVFSIVGATVATSFVRQVMFMPYLFQVIVALSLVFATLSAFLYLRRNGLLSWAGAQRKWRYLSVMYGSTLAINLVLFWFVFPAVANLDLVPRVSAAPAAISTSQTGRSSADPANLGEVTLRVDIPCPGHAPLIIGELRNVPGVRTAKYQSPDVFWVLYDTTVTSVDKILAQEVFQSFPASVAP